MHWLPLVVNHFPQFNHMTYIFLGAYLLLPVSLGILEALVAVILVRFSILSSVILEDLVSTDSDMMAWQCNRVANSILLNGRETQ